MKTPYFNIPQQRIIYLDKIEKKAEKWNSAMQIIIKLPFWVGKVQKDFSFGKEHSYLINNEFISKQALSSLSFILLTLRHKGGCFKKCDTHANIPPF